MSATITSTSTTTTATVTMASSSSSRTPVSTISAHLLVDFAWDELDLPLDRDVGAGLLGDLLTLLDWLLYGLLLGNVGATLLRVLTALRAGDLDGLLAAGLVRLGLTGLDGDLAAALLRFLAALGCSVTPSVGRLGGLTFSHVLGGALVVIGCGADLQTMI